MCPECVADGVGALECTVEYRHTVSSGIGVTVESLVIEAGYWRATETSATILPCWNEGACRGGATGASDFCDEGYAGPCEWIIMSARGVGHDRKSLGMDMFVTAALERQLELSTHPRKPGVCKG